MQVAELRARSAHLERAGVLLLLVAAMLPRVRDSNGPFDREAEGWQGAFFALCAINYERTGFGTFGGYPVYNIDLPTELDVPEAERADRWLLYANHSPAVAWLAWAGAKAFGPDGWQDAWREGRAPDGLELALRLPFLVFHLFGLWAFWWAVRQGVSAQQAMLALAFLALTPVSMLYGTLVNYETPSVALVLLAYGFHVRWLKRRRPRELLAAAVAFALASGFTYGPLFFGPPLVLLALAHRGLRAASRTAVMLGGGAALAVLAHALAARRAFESLGRDPGSLSNRVDEMLSPLLDGTAPVPVWAAAQWRHLRDYVGWPLVAVAAAGLLVALVRAWRGRHARDESAAASELERVDLALPLTLGAWTMLFAYYKHNLTEQTTFLLNVAPGLAALAGLALHSLSGPLLRLRGGIAPLVVATGLVAMPGLRLYGDLHSAWRAPGPRDEPPGERGPDLPLPDTYGHALAEVVPAGATAFYPAAMGLSLSYYYYAWRSLKPLEQPDPFHKPTYLVLPTHPAAGSEAGVNAARAFFEQQLPELAARAPTAENAHWRAWLLEAR